MVPWIDDDDDDDYWDGLDDDVPEYCLDCGQLIDDCVCTACPQCDAELTYSPQTGEIFCDECGWGVKSS